MTGPAQKRLFMHYLGHKPLRLWLDDRWIILFHSLLSLLFRWLVPLRAIKGKVTEWQQGCLQESTWEISIRWKNISASSGLGAGQGDPVSPQCKQTLKQTARQWRQPTEPSAKEAMTVCRETLRHSNKQTVTQSALEQEMLVTDKQGRASGSRGFTVF